MFSAMLSMAIREHTAYNVGMGACLPTRPSRQNGQEEHS